MRYGLWGLESAGSCEVLDRNGFLLIVGVGLKSDVLNIYYQIDGLKSDMPMQINCVEH